MLGEKNEDDGYKPINFSNLKSKHAAKTTSKNRFLKWALIAAITMYVVLFKLPLLLSFTSFINKTELPHDTSIDVSALLLNILKSSNYAGDWSKIYTAHPHLAGQGLDLVEFTQNKFAEYGLASWNETYEVYMNLPVENSLSLLEIPTSSDATKAGVRYLNSSEPRVVYEASLIEDPLKEDPTTIGDDLTPAFHGYSASGNVTAEYVYVNYGTKSDFKTLGELGVDFTDKICIVKYGSIFRGLKVKFAQEAGCSGVIIYSDPGDDYFKEADGYKPYPKGPARNPSSIQRGSVQFLSQVPGDPTTPGKPSVPGAKRTDPYKSIPKIPSLPMSFRSVLPILEKLNGHGIACSDIPDSTWCTSGGLSSFDYSTGPNPSYQLNLYNNQSYDIRPIYNVYGNLTGTGSQPGYILIGNHRDGWAGSASDPNSGSAVLLEVARALHEITLTTGWRPSRDIVFASWDGEEYGLLGSTEFGELHSKNLKGHCIAYLNVDVAVGGTKLNVQSSPSLNKLLRESMKSVTYEEADSETSLFDDFFSRNEKIGILGSGSDYTVFLEHLGIPSVDMGFTSGPEDPVYHYHSNYDSYHWMSTMQDPGFVYHNRLAQFLGASLVKLSERQVLNMYFEEYATEMIGYFEDLTSKIPISWLTYVPPKAEKTLAVLISETKEVFDGFHNYTITMDTRTDSLQFSADNPDSVPFWKRFGLKWRILGQNMKIQFFERLFIYKKGLTGRKWYKHIVYAAGKDTGYEGFAFPGLKEALDDQNVAEFYRWAKIIKKILNHKAKKADDEKMSSCHMA